MTIHRSKIRGGPAGDAGLGALAAAVRYGYAMGLIPDEDHQTDRDHVELFAAFLAGQGPPTRPT